MIRVLLLIIGLWWTVDCVASQPMDTLPDIRGKHKNADEAMRRLDSLLDKRDSLSRLRVDTNYLQRARQHFILKFRLNASGSNLDVKTYTDDAIYHVDLEAQMKQTFSVSASYRGLSLGFSVNPAHFTGKNNDYEFNINAYGNRMGADVIFQSTKTFQGTMVSPNGDSDVPAGLVKYRMLTVNTYYAFNSRRFSYPAAFTQSWTQKRGSGSFMLGISFMGGNIQLTGDSQVGNQASRVSIACASVGAGYGYNFVLPRQWLIHVSSLPELVLFTHSKMTVDGAQEKMPYRFPNIILVGRIAVVKHFGKYFLGMTTVANVSKIGDREQLEFSNVKWRARLFLGLKLF